MWFPMFHSHLFHFQVLVHMLLSLSPSEVSCSHHLRHSFIKAIWIDLANFVLCLGSEVQEHGDHICLVHFSIISLQNSAWHIVKYNINIYSLSERMYDRVRSLVTGVFFFFFPSEKPSNAFRLESEILWGTLRQRKHHIEIYRGIWDVWS